MGPSGGVNVGLGPARAGIRGGAAGVRRPLYPFGGEWDVRVAQDLIEECLGLFRDVAVGRATLAFLDAARERRDQAGTGVGLRDGRLSQRAKVMEVPVLPVHRIDREKLEGIGCPRRTA